MTTLTSRLTIPQAASAVLAGVYLSGFVVLNAHLGQSGVYVLDVASLRYAIAGMPFVIFLVFWYLFPGRVIFHATQWLAEEIESASRTGLGGVWPAMCFLNMTARFVFMTCMAAAGFSFILMGNTEAVAFYRYMVVLFLIVYPWDFLNFDIRFPRVHIIFELTTRLLGSLLFFVGIGLTGGPGGDQGTVGILMAGAAAAASSSTMHVFFTFVALSAFFNLVLDSFERFKISGDRIAYNAVYTALFVLLSAAIFGRLHYENIRTDFGGGQLQTVEMIIADQAARNGLEEWGFDTTPFLKAELIYQDEREYVVDVEGQTIKLAREVVVGVRVVREDNGS